MLPNELELEFIALVVVELVETVVELVESPLQ
jgi:hypothetical protein